MKFKCLLLRDWHQYSVVAFGGNWVVSAAGSPLKMLDKLLCLMAAVNDPDEKKCLSAEMTILGVSGREHCMWLQRLPGCPCRCLFPVLSMIKTSSHLPVKWLKAGNQTVLTFLTWLLQQKKVDPAFSEVAWWEKVPFSLCCFSEVSLFLPVHSCPLCCCHLAAQRLPLAGSVRDQDLVASANPTICVHLSMLSLAPWEQG